MILILTVLWILFAISEGYFEAYYYDAKNRVSVEHRNLHPYYFVKRVIIGIIFILSIDASWFISGLYLLCFGLIFFYFHDGMYFYMRNKLNNTIYKLKWCDYNDSIAVLEPNYIERVGFMLMGFAGIIIIYLLL